MQKVRGETINIYTLHSAAPQVRHQSPASANVQRDETGNDDGWAWILIVGAIALVAAVVCYLVFFQVILNVGVVVLGALAGWIASTIFLSQRRAIPLGSSPVLVIIQFGILVVAYAATWTASLELSRGNLSIKELRGHYLHGYESSNGDVGESVQLGLDAVAHASGGVNPFFFVVQEILANVMLIGIFALTARASFHLTTVVGRSQAMPAAQTKSPVVLLAVSFLFAVIAIFLANGGLMEILASDVFTVRIPTPTSTSLTTP